MSCNRARIGGRLEFRKALRFTPAGIAVIEFAILHRSQQFEAGAQRQVDCEVLAMAVEAVAQQVAKFPKHAQVQAEGFLDRISRTQRELILHVEKIELIEER